LRANIDNPSLRLDQHPDDGICHAVGAEDIYVENFEYLIICPGGKHA